mmetsp:Transcript_100977/g.308787  ORF Transcript_100977/g.308787 Transcript_100977/m.308787 type:complete len:274 (+) Transcript_100977:1370-2191(+)
MECKFLPRKDSSRSRKFCVRAFFSSAVGFRSVDVKDTYLSNLSTTMWPYLSTASLPKCSLRDVSSSLRCALEPHFRHACTTWDPKSVQQYSGSVAERSASCSKISFTMSSAGPSLPGLMSWLYNVVTSFLRIFFALIVLPFFVFFSSASAPSASRSARFLPWACLSAAAAPGEAFPLPAPLPAPLAPPLAPPAAPALAPAAFLLPLPWPLPPPFPPALLLSFLFFKMDFLVGRPRAPSDLPPPWAARLPAFLPMARPPGARDAGGGGPRCPKA